MRSLLIYITSLAVGLIFSSTTFAQTGSIRGTVTDKATGESLVGVNIYIEDPFMGTVSDLDGNFSIDKVSSGTYTVVISYVSYTTQKIKSVVVRPNDVTILNVALASEALGLQEVVVEARALKNTENAILAMQKRSLHVQDAISSQEISRIGAGNAAESMNFVTGASVLDGKYVYVRGLGDRYTSTQLNGMTMVSSDPYRNSAQLDLIPSNLLDNIVTTKTFTPDQPGNFTGGNVSINTKAFPEKFTLRFSTSLAYNSQSSFNQNFLTHDGGSLDWLGYDDGTRSIPGILLAEDIRKKLTSGYYVTARSSEDDAMILDEASKALNNQMAPTKKTSFTNYGASFSFGNQYKIFNQPLGIIFGLLYKRDYSFYEDGISAVWDITGISAEELTPYAELNDTRAVESPKVNGLLNLSYKLNNYNELGVNVIYNHDADKISRYQYGKIPGVVSNSNTVFETRTLHFKERGVNTYQLRGKHMFPSLNQAEIEWIGGISNSFQEEPDLRLFANERINDSLYLTRISEYEPPSHFFRYLNDDLKEFKADITVPIKKNKENKIKIGALANDKDRDFDEYRFKYNNRDGELYQGDPVEFFGPANTGVIGYDSSKSRYIIGQYVVDDTKPANTYTGSENVFAGYGMLIYNIMPQLKFIGGLRAESTQMNVMSADTSRSEGDINELDWLPSLNLIYNVTENMNLRGSATRTIARPTMRELAPFVSFDYIGGFYYVGNPELERTLIYNFDLRLELYPCPGELFAVSAFYKDFTNPIVKVYNSEASNPEILFQNTPKAEVYGAELELRKNLDVISQVLRDFKFSINLTYILSEVDMDPVEYAILSSINPDTKPYRPFQGQSPYLLNTFLNYNNDSLQLDINVNFNIFGERLSEIGKEGVPDIYEAPRAMLNFNMSKGFDDHLELSFGIDNILDAEFKKVHNFREKEYISEFYNLGRSFSLGVSYKIN